MPIPDHVKPRLKLDKARTKAALPVELNATDAEVDAALLEVDQDAIYDAERAKHIVEVWDRTSPINGVLAQKVLESRTDIGTGDHDIYLVKDAATGRVVMFQPHEPEVEGLVRIPKGQGLTKGNQHTDKIAAENAAPKVVEQVRQKIIANREQV